MSSAALSVSCDTHAGPHVATALLWTRADGASQGGWPAHLVKTAVSPKPLSLSALALMQIMA